MNFKDTLESVENSEVYKKFKEKHPDAELCAGFFIDDYISNDTKNSIDYKKGETIFTFNVTEDKVDMYEDKIINLPHAPKLEKIKPETKIEVNELKTIAKEKAYEEGIGAAFNKIIAILQIYNNEKTNEKLQVWNLTCMLDQLIILHIIVSSETGEIVKFERKSMMDMIRKK